MASFFKITAGAGIVAVALYAAAGYVGVPTLVKQTLVDTLSKELNREVTVGKVDFNPWTWEFELHQLAIQGKNNNPPLAELALLRLDASAQSITAFAPVLDEITVDGLHACLTLDDEDIRRYLGLDQSDQSSSKSAATEKKSDTDSGLPQFALYNISVKNSSLQVLDRARAIDQSITDFELQLPFVSTLPNAKESLVTPALSMKLNDTPIIATGSTKPFGTTLEAQLSTKISQLDLVPIFKLVPAANTPALTLESGRLTTELNFIFRNPTGGQPGKMLLSGTASVANLVASQHINHRHQPLASVAKTTVQLTELDLIERQAKVHSVIVQDPKVTLLNSSSGLNATKVSDAFASEGSSSAQPSSKATSSDTPQWHWKVDTIQVRNGTLLWQDTTVKPNAKLNATALNATLTGLSSDATKPATAEASVKMLGGSANLTAHVVAQPLSVQANLKTSQLKAGQLNSYIQAATGFNGQGMLTLDLHANLKGDALTANGSANLTHFQLREGKSTLVSAQQTAVTLGELDLKRQKIRVDKALLKGAVLNVVKNKPTKAEPESASTDADTKPNTQVPAWQWEVASAQIQDARLHFKDNTHKPAVALNISNINASVKHLTSKPNTQGDVSLSAHLAGGSTAVAGKLGVAPLTANMTTSIKQIALKDLHSALVAYTGIGARSGALNSEGKLQITQVKEAPVYAWLGNIDLANFNMTNSRNRSLMMWKDASLTGLDVKTTDPLHLRIAEAVIDQPGTRETKKVKEIAGLASALAALSGKDRLTQKIEKVESRLDGKIVLKDIRYENGSFSANGVSANSLAGAILAKLSKEMSAKLDAASTTTQAKPATAKPTQP